MPTVATFRAPLPGLQQPLVLAVRRWTEQIQRQDWKEAAPRGIHRAPLLTLTPVTPGLLDIQPLAAAWPLSRLAIADKQLHKSLFRQVTLLALETAATEGDLWLALSDLAWETARSSLLVGTTDSLAVSAHSGLGALALANFLWLFQQALSRPQQPPGLDLLRQVVQPLEVAQQLSQPQRSGDLWVGLTIARTVNDACRKVAAKFPAFNDENRNSHSLDLLTLCQRTAPLFVRHSTLCKLVDAPRLAPYIAQRAAYKMLPGLETLTSDAQSSSARRLLTSELAFNLQGSGNHGAARGALLRWLEGLSQLPAAGQAAAALNIAHVLWELLEIDQETPVATTSGAAATKDTTSPLARLWTDKEVGSHLQRAMTTFERLARSDGGEPEMMQRLRDVRDCLHCYPAYRALLPGLPKALPVEPTPAPSQN